MRLIKSHTCKKRGFTLLELVLAMAIMLIVVPFVFGTLYIINVSHANVTLVNDAKDYATLNGRAIENILINAKEVKVSSSATPESPYSVLYFDSTAGGKLLLNGAAPFDFDHYTVKDGATSKQKWNLDIVFQLDKANKTLNYTIKVMDNAKASKPVKYTLNGSVYLPSAQTDLLVGTTGNVVKFKEPAF